MHHVFSNIWNNGYGDVHVFAKVDPERKVIHLLDCHGPTSLTNSVEHLLGKVLVEEELDGNVTDWKWLLYGRDDSVFEYDITRPFADGRSGFNYVARKMDENDLVDKDIFCMMKGLSRVFESRSRYDLIYRLFSFSSRLRKEFIKESEGDFSN